MKNFRTYNLSVEFYKSISNLNLPSHLRNQLDRAASTISLNLAEGFGRQSQKERLHFYQIALGSLRECQAILELGAGKESASFRLADRVGANLFKLIQMMKRAA